MKVKKQGKLFYTNQSSIPVDIPPTSPPMDCISHEGAFEMEKEVLKEAEEDKKDTKLEDEQSLITSQDNSCDDTEMWLPVLSHLHVFGQACSY